MTQIVYLPCEILTRELDARVELMRSLRDCTVVIGQQWDIFSNAHRLPTGSILFKTCNQIQGVNMRKWHEQGHTVCTLDEESLLGKSADALTQAVSPLAMFNCTYFLANNQAHADAVAPKFPGGTTLVVGNQRLDLCRDPKNYAAEAEEIKREHGDFVLINTNFGVINSHWGGYAAARQIHRQAGLLETQKQDDEFTGGAEWEKTNMASVYQLIRELLSRGFKIVLRPHPGEDPKVWKAIPGITVVEHTVPLPWMAAAQMSFHCSCTTGLEAAIMGVPTISLKPCASAISRINDEINPTVSTPEEAIDLMEKGVDMREYTKICREMFPAGATESIAKVLRQAAPILSFNPSFEIDSTRRTDLQKTKFSLSVEEAWNMLGPCTPLADSLFVKHSDKDLEAAT